MRHTLHIRDAPILSCYHESKLGGLERGRVWHLQALFLDGSIFESESSD